MFPGSILSRRPFFGAMFLMLFFWTVPASATTMVFSDLERMIEISDVIVEGIVVSQKTYLSEALGNQMVTTTTVEPKQVFLGEKKESYSFTQWGGEFDGKVAHIPGDAAFKIGEEVILFLARPKHPNEKGHLFLSLLSQSKYSLSTSGNTRMVTRDLSDAAFMDPETSEFTKHGDDFFRYDAFVAELSAQIAGIKGGKK